MTEFEQAAAIANKMLDRVSADPDDDIAILARQFLRAKERADERDSFSEQIGKLYKVCNERDVLRNAAGPLVEACLTVWASYSAADDPELRRVANECRAAVPDHYLVRVSGHEVVSNIAKD